MKNEELNLLVRTKAFVRRVMPCSGSPQSRAANVQPPTAQVSLAPLMAAEGQKKIAPGKRSPGAPPGVDWLNAFLTCERSEASNASIIRERPVHSAAINQSFPYGRLGSLRYGFAGITHYSANSRKSPRKPMKYFFILHSSFYLSLS
jgi:hypothetical protein